MPETLIDKLQYGIGVDVSGFGRDADEIARKVKSLGATASQAFERDFGKRLAQAIDPKRFQSQLEQANKILARFSPQASTSFQQALGRQLSQSIAAANAQTKGFVQSIIEGTSSLGKFGQVASAVATGNLAAGLVLGLGRAATAALKFASDFETSLARVQTIAEKSFNLDFVRQRIIELSKQVPQDVLKLTAGLTQIIGTGIKDTGDALKLLEQGTKNAVAGFTDTKTAVDPLITVLSVYSKSVEEAGHVSDILFKTIDLGKIEFTDLAQGVAEVTAPAALAGIRFEEVAAAIAAMTVSGLPAAESFTALRRLIGEIINPSEKAAEQAKALGIELSKSGLQAAGSFANYIKIIQGVDPQLLNKLFPEERALRGIQFLAGVAAGKFQDFAKQLGNTAETSGAANKAFEIVNATAERQFEILKNNLNVAFLDFGKTLLEIVSPALRTFNDLLAGTTDTEKVLRALNAVGAAGKTAFGLGLVAEMEKSQMAIDQLSEQIKRFASDASAIPGSVESADKTFFEKIFGSVDLVREVASEYISLARDAAGQAEIEKEIEQRSANILELSERFNREKGKGNEEEAEFLRKQIEGENKRIEIASKVLLFQKATEEQQKNINRLQEELRTGQKRADDEKSGAQAKALDAGKKDIETSKETLRLRKEAAKFIEEAANRLEQLSASSDIEKRLIVIRQEADERRKLFAFSEKAIRAAGRLEREEVAKTLEVSLAAERIKRRGVPKTEKELKSELEREIKLVAKLKIEIPEREFETISDKLNRELLKITEPFTGFIDELFNVGILIDDEFVDLVSLIDSNLGSLLDSFRSFATELGTGNIIGAIPSGAKLFGDIAKFLIGSGEDKGLAESAKRLTDAFKELEAQIRRNELSVGDLEGKIGDVTNSLRALTGVGTASSEAFVQFSDIFRQIRERFGEISSGHELDKFLSEVENTILDAFGENSDVFKIFKRFINILSPAEQQEVSALIQQLILLQSGLDEFGKSLRGLQGIFDDLRLEFELLDVDEPVARLKRFREEILENFGAVIPETQEGIEKLIREGLKALLAGGESLRDFLTGINLEELTAEQFRDFLEFLENLAEQTTEKMEEIGNGFEKLINDLGLEFGLLDIDDPVKKLERLRERIEKEFGAIIPRTQSEIEELIKGGLAALLAGGDALKAFLASIDLEELTEEQFRSFLEFLEGLADDAREKAEEIESAEEKTGVSAVKAITFQQGNVLLDELATIRDVATQMLDIMRQARRDSGLPTIPEVGNTISSQFGFNGMLSSLTEITAAQYEAELRTNEILGEILDRLENGPAQTNIFLVKGDNVAKSRLGELEEIDRALIEKAVVVSRSRGLV